MEWTLHFIGKTKKELIESKRKKPTYEKTQVVILTAGISIYSL